MGGSFGKESARDALDLGPTPGLGRTPGGGNGNPLRYSCLEHPTDRGSLVGRVHGVAESDTTATTAHTRVTKPAGRLPGVALPSGPQPARARASQSPRVVPASRGHPGGCFPPGPPTRCPLAPPQPPSGRRQSKATPPPWKAGPHCLPRHPTRPGEAEGAHGPVLCCWRGRRAAVLTRCPCGRASFKGTQARGRL